MPTKNESRTYYLYLIKSVIFLGILYFIYRKVQDHPDDFLSLYRLVRDKLSITALMIIVVMVPVNWGLEVAKWRYLMRVSHPITWVESIKGVLSGLAMGFITPHGIGDYFGRLAAIDKPRKLTLLGLIFISRMAQLSVTVLFGLWGVQQMFRGAMLLKIVALFIVAAGLLFILLKFITSGKRNYYFTLFGRYFRVLRSLSPASYLVVFGLSAFRYLIFAFQMALAIRVFAGIDWKLSFAGTTWILLSKSVIPSFNFLSDLGIREFSAIYFYDEFGVSPVPIIAATLLIWCLNIVFPTLVGAMLILKMRFR